MLTPSPIQRFNVEPMHPHFVPEVEAEIEGGHLVVTVNDSPVEGVLGFSVPDGYVKRIATKDELDRIAKRADDNLLARVCRDGIRVKGVVRVFVRT